MRVYRDDQKFLTFRINALLWTIVGVFVFLAGSFWFVQGVQAEKYRGLSESNALREIVSPAKRGMTISRRAFDSERPRYFTAPETRVQPVISLEEILHARKLVDQIHVDE